MKNVIVGTAGHIDHGKTALVKALTGIDADRLAEEKRRGITIDLGFAHLQLTLELRLGFVDVPGHERFVKNMLAGVGGIDVVLFVVAANESIKPQTREHFEICRLLEIPRGVIALTKADLVEPGLLDLVRLEVEELAEGSFLEGAPIVPVSSVTGAGLDALRIALARATDDVPEKSAMGWFRLPIDRIFSLRGFGTVVTGTLISGAVERDQEVEVHPGGRRLRVRGIEVHGEAAVRATAGQRTALNLADVEPAELARGDVLSEAGRFRSVRCFDCRLELLCSAKPLKHRAPVHFHAGSAEIEAEVRLPNGAAALLPGSRAIARIVLREPALLLPGDRFIIRMFSPITTIGGGVVIDIAGAKRCQQTRIETLEAASPAQRAALLVREAPFGMAMRDVVALTGLTEATIALSGALLVRAPEPWLVDPAWFASAREHLVQTVRQFHQTNPLRPGIPKADLLAGAPPFLLEALPELALEGDDVRLRTHQVVLNQAEEGASAAIERAFIEAGLAAPSVSEVLARSGIEAAPAQALLRTLLREKRLVRVGQDLVFHQSALEGLRRMLAARKSSRFRVPEFKKWTGVSRKYAIPLLEYLDRERITRRQGDERVVL